MASSKVSDDPRGPTPTRSGIERSLRATENSAKRHVDHRPNDIGVNPRSREVEPHGDRPDDQVSGEREVEIFGDFTAPGGALERRSQWLTPSRKNLVENVELGRAGALSREARQTPWPAASC